MGGVGWVVVAVVPVVVVVVVVGGWWLVGNGHPTYTTKSTAVRKLIAGRLWPNA